MTTTTSPSRARRDAFSASLTYALMLAGPGAYVPFFPLWLLSRGFDPRQIGILLAIPTLPRVAGVIFARFGDGSLGPARTFAIAAAGMAVAYLGLVVAHDFWTVAALLGVAALIGAPMNPLLDTVVLDGVARHGHDYGRIRQWGSSAFLVTSLAAGAGLTVLPIEMVPWLLGGLALANAAAALFLSNARAAPARDSASAAGPRSAARPATAVFVLLATGLACHHGAHAFLFSFATLIWQQAGYSNAQLGVLWAVPIVTESTLFVFAGVIERAIGHRAMIGGGIAIAILRWTLMGLDPHSGLALGALQALHGITFAAVTAGTMAWLGRFKHGQATRQGIAASAISLVWAVVAFGAGSLYANLGVHAYWVMAGIGVLGAVLVGLAWQLEGRAEPAPVAEKG